MLPLKFLRLKVFLLYYVVLAFLRPVMWLDIGLRHRLQTRDLWALPQLPFSFLVTSFHHSCLEFLCGHLGQGSRLPVLHSLLIAVPVQGLLPWLSLCSGARYPARITTVSWLPAEGPLLVWGLVLWALPLMRLKQKQDLIKTIFESSAKWYDALIHWSDQHF